MWIGGTGFSLLDVRECIGVYYGHGIVVVKGGAEYMTSWITLSEVYRGVTL